MANMRIRDISPRLTFQAQNAATSQKVELADRLIAAGVSAIELSSFVSPKLVPGLADAEAVFAQVRRREGVSLECCVGNVTGLRRAIDAGAHAAWFLLSADEEFSKNNIGRTIEDSLEELGRMCEVASSSDIRLGTYMISIFGGPGGLPRAPHQMKDVASRLTELGVYDWILADSCGYAAPPQMRDMVTFAARLTGKDHLTVQVHDSRGMGLANIAQLVELGVGNIDTSLAGSGGHPAMADAPVGGVCSEDAVQMLELMDVHTGVDLAALIEAANWLDSILGGQEKGFARHVGKVPLNAAEVESARVFQRPFKWSK